MSMQPRPTSAVPERTAQLAQRAFRRGNPYVAVRDHLGPIYDDARFAALFAVRGQPAESPGVLALVTVLQHAEGLSDVAAANAMAARLDWKYLLGLEPDAPGCDPSVLAEFRARFVGPPSPEAVDPLGLLLDAVVEVCQAHGLITDRSTQRTGSTHVLASVHDLTRLELVGETLRHALEALSVVDASWLRQQVDATWADRYSQRLPAQRLPKSAAKRAALAATIGADGVRLLTALWAPTAPVYLRRIPAVATLRQVWVQQFYAPDRRRAVRWRQTADLPPASQRIVSPDDVEARVGAKRDLVWAGYKVHLTETCAPDTPHLIVHVETTPAHVHDSEMTMPIVTALANRDLSASQQVVDMGYVSGDHLVRSQTDYGVDLLGPAPLDTSWQAKAGQGML